MTKRGAKSHVTIAVSSANVSVCPVLNQLEDYLAKNGKGRSVPLLEIFPGTENRGKRHAARRLEALGVLQAAEIDFLGEMLRVKHHAGRESHDTSTSAL